MDSKNDEEVLHSLLRHDLKNKLQVAIGYLQLLKDMDLSDEQKDFIEKSIKSLREGNELIQKIRHVREVDKHEKKYVSLKKQIESAINDNLPLMKKKNINIKYDKKDCRVLGGELLENLFFNLIKNTIQHSRCDEIKITTNCTKGECKVIVEDDGIGIPPELNDKIFEIGTAGGKNAGSGLGLYFVKEIVNNYDGHIELKKSQKKGTKFDIVLKR